ncbi:MAG: SDR family oxidoreductase [Synergistaceae bacterium]|nr:SDR family oxidoreductase [Synergistaceae bacterium]
MSRWILVAGASRGIGLETARLLLKENFSVVASARDTRPLEEEFANVGDDRLKIVPFDFSQVEKTEGYVSRIIALTGGISGMLYSAGAQKTLPLTQSKFPIAEEIFRVNAFGAFELVRVLAKNAKKGDGGASFVLISSLAAREGALGKALYGAGKGALEGFIPPAAAELAARNIRLNAVALGVIRTDMSMEFIGKMSEEQRKSLEESYPLGLGEPEDAARFIVYLLSENARWITGQTFVLDGGHMVRGC